MISEGSCDIKDWSGDAENSVFFITRINCIRKQNKTAKTITL